MKMQDYTPSSSRKKWARFALGAYLFLEGALLFSGEQSRYSRTYDFAFEALCGKGLLASILPVFVTIFAIAGSLLTFSNNSLGYMLAAIVFTLQLIAIHLGHFTGNFMRKADSSNEF